MTIQDLKDWLPIVSSLVEAAALAVAAYLAWRIYRHQTYVSVVLAFTERYERLMRDLDFESRYYLLGLVGNVAELRHETKLALIWYFDLCAQEYFLYRKGYLGKDVWLMWEKELRQVLTRSLVSDMWRDSLSPKYSSHPSFRSLVDSVVNDIPRTGALPKNVRQSLGDGGGL